MNSDTKNAGLVQVLTSSEEFFVFKKQTSQTLEEKMKHFYLFITFFLHQTSKNKKVTGNIIHDSSEVVLLCRWTVWVICLPALTLTLTERENKI